jgi:hypothetical protein
MLLAAAALFWPASPSLRGDGALLVLMPEPDPRRREALDSLAQYLGRSGRLELRVELVGDRAAFREALGDALLLVCPDGVALPLPSASWQPLAVGRRRMPWNLRPAPVLVTRRPDAAGATPWFSDPGRTVFGDSLSLVCLAPLCDRERGLVLPRGVSWGQDPYDHEGVLEAARHGAYDHAVVRQWDAERALAAGRLDPAVWQVRPLAEPVPDVVILASRRLAQGVRLDLQEALTVLGRRTEGNGASEGKLSAQLMLMGLEGFNLLLGPDFDAARRRYGGCWPPVAD